MDTVASARNGDNNAGGVEADVNRYDIPERILSGGDVMRQIENAREVLTRIELDVARSSEKQANLSILMMHVATKESEFEAFISDEKHILKDFGEMALEFDLLSGFLDSEVSELENFMSTLQADIVNAREIICSYEHLGETLKDMEEILCDSEESLRQSLEQVSEIKEQSSNVQRNLLSGGEETWKDNRNAELVENGDFSNLNPKIKMQTAEQQRHILRMLEKSLARELDLEKKLAESRQIEEYLKLELHSSEHEIFCIEVEAVATWERLFEGENTAEVLMGISKELLGRLQILQLNLNGSNQREGDLRLKLHDSIERLKAKDAALQKIESSNTELNEFLFSQTNALKASLREREDKLVVVDSEAFTLREKVSLLEKQLKEHDFQQMNARTSGDGNQDLLPQLNEMSSVLEDLKEKITKAESRADSAEAKCKLLTENNMELNEQLNLLKDSGNTSERVDILERQLRESDILLQRAVASAEASQEKQSLLDSTIKDMENLIDGLKLKVLKAESLSESAEDKCIILSESNSDLNEELRFLRVRMDCLKASLHQAEEKKKATAKDIRIRTKLITDLVMQMALERERLQKQISSLTKENKILVKQLHQTSNSPVKRISHDGQGDEHHLTTVILTGESKNVAEFLSTDTRDETKMGLC